MHFSKKVFLILKIHESNFLIKYEIYTLIKIRLYLDKIKLFMNKHDIKVLTSVKRCGKSKY